MSKTVKEAILEMSTLEHAKAWRDEPNKVFYLALRLERMISEEFVGRAMRILDSRYRYFIKTDDEIASMSAIDLVMWLYSTGADRFFNKEFGTEMGLHELQDYAFVYNHE